MKTDQLCSYCTVDLRLCFCIWQIVGFLMGSASEIKVVDKSKKLLQKYKWIEAEAHVENPIKIVYSGVPKLIYVYHFYLVNLVSKYLLFGFLVLFVANIPSELITIVQSK